MQRLIAWLVGAACCLFVGAHVVAAQTVNAPAIKWTDSLKQKPDWYGTTEAARIADNVLLYQRDTGGWPKNIDMAAVLTEQGKADLVKQKPQTDDSDD